MGIGTQILNSTPYTIKNVFSEKYYWISRNQNLVISPVLSCSLVSLLNRTVILIYLLCFMLW